MFLKRLILSTTALSLLSSSLSGCNLNVDIFLSNIDDNVSTIREWGTNAWNNTLEWGTNAWNTISTWGKSTWSQIVDWSTNTGEAVAEWGQTVVDGTTNFFCNVGDYVMDVANGFVTFGLKRGVDSLNLSKGLEEGTEDDWKEYSNDFEAITYALVSTQLQKVYDVFPAKLEIPSTKQEVYGYAFTDYKTKYVYHQGENDQENYFSTGFISLVNEFVVPPSDINKGIEIYRTEDNDATSTHYFYGFNCEPFDSHCVIKGQYLKYGVNGDHQIYYENSEYDGTSDESLGGLYSFDDKNYIYGEDNGFIPTKGNVLDETFDFESWKSETKNTFLKGISLKLADLKNIITDAIAKVKTVINNLNEQTILGYNIDDIKKAINNTSENDIATVENDKVAMHSVDNEIPSSLDSTAKWIVGFCTAIAVIANIGVVLFFPKVTSANTAINAAVSAVSGAAIELSVQTLIDNKGFKDVNWIKIGIAAVVGGLAGLLPETNSKIKGSITTSLIAAVTTMSYRFLDGGSFLNSALSFVSSFVIALILSTALTTIASGFEKLANKVAPKLMKKVNLFIQKHQIIVGGKSMQENVSGLNDAVTREASQSASNASVDSRTTVFNTKEAVKHLPGDKNKYLALTDETGKIITKQELLNNSGNGYLVLKNNEAAQRYSALFVDKNGNLLTRIPIKNGYVQFQSFDSTIVNLSKGNSLISNRSENFKMFDDCLKKALINNPESVAPDVLQYFRNLGVDFDSLTCADFKMMRSILNKTWHEAENRGTGILIDTTLHNFISHMGGFSLSKALAAYHFPTQIILAMDQAVLKGV